MINTLSEKCLETLNRRDYHEFREALKPEMEKAKRSITGKQINSVSSIRPVLLGPVLTKFQVEKKMHRSDFDDDIDSISSTQHMIHPSDVTTGAVDAPPTPPLTSEAQSPQSSSLPSANASTVDEPVHTSLSHKGFTDSLNGVTIANTEHNS
jgi:mRNA-binding protein PUF3